MSEDNKTVDTAPALEISQDSSRIMWGESTAQDFRFALRTLRKRPGFTAIVILTLALGMGANTAIFQLLDAVRLRTLPVPNPQALAAIQIRGGNRGFGVTTGDNETLLSYPLWEQIRSHQQVFSGVFAWATSSSATIGEGGQQRRGLGLWVSGEIFSTLGVLPLKGRVFSAEDDTPGCGIPGVVISYPLWQSEFGGRDSAIGSKLAVQNRLTEVIGVTPPGFFGLEVGRHFDFAVPFCSLPSYFPNAETLAKKDLFWVRVMGRLKPGVTVEQASSQLNGMSAGFIEATIPEGYNSTSLAIYRRYRLAAYPGANGISALRNTYDRPLRLLLGTTGLVLLIACANIANLLLARASTREREMAVRLALGASRWRLIRELLSEALVLATAGAVLGIALAEILSRSMVKFLSTEGDVVQLDLGIDWRLLVFTGTAALLTCVVFGLAPAIRSSRAEPGVVLKAGSRGSTGARERFSFQRLLVVSQIAVSLVLLVGALLFVRSFRNLVSVDPGFRKKDIVIAIADFRKFNLPSDRSRVLVRNLLTEIKTVPQVESAATSTHIPLYPGLFWNLGVHVEGAEGSSRFIWVSPGYFHIMQMPLLGGRDFDDRDTDKSPRVAIVNETFSRKYLGGKNPAGKTIRTNAEPGYPESEYEIVGVIKDTKYEELREPTPPMVFAPAEQFPATTTGTFLFVRSSSPASALIAAVREKIAQNNPELTMEFHVFQTDIENGLTRERVMALLSGFFGALAALLAMIGLYGVISYIIALRRNEIGIRMALGASRQDVVRVILRQTLFLLALGVALGLTLALAATQGAGSLLFGLQPNDPLSLFGAAGFLVVVALVASYVPARRASRLEPMKALRYE